VKRYTSDTKAAMDKPTPSHQGRR